MLTFDAVEWDEEDDPDGNVQHVLRHGVSKDEVEDVLGGPAITHDISRSSGLPMVFGRTFSNRHIAVIYKAYTKKGLIYIYPVTAFDVEP